MDYRYLLLSMRSIIGLIRSQVEGIDEAWHSARRERGKRVLSYTYGWTMLWYAACRGDAVSGR